MLLPPGSSRGSDVILLILKWAVDTKQVVCPPEEVRPRTSSSLQKDSAELSHRDRNQGVRRVPS
eukprot:4796791-Prorocentrum_lima.AAC.1